MISVIEHCTRRYKETTPGESPKCLKRSPRDFHFFDITRRFAAVKTQKRGFHRVTKKTTTLVAVLVYVWRARQVSNLWPSDS